MAVTLEARDVARLGIDRQVVDDFPDTTDHADAGHQTLALGLEYRTAQGHLTSERGDLDRTGMADEPANFRPDALNQNHVAVVDRDESIANLGQETTSSMLEIFAADPEGATGHVSYPNHLVASEGSATSPVLRIEEIHCQEADASPFDE
jgi:hypothetical protein